MRGMNPSSSSHSSLNVWAVLNESEACTVAIANLNIMTQTDAFLLFRNVVNSWCGVGFYFFLMCFNGDFFNACFYILTFEPLGCKSKKFSANSRALNTFIPRKTMVMEWNLEEEHHIAQDVKSNHRKTSKEVLYTICDTARELRTSISFWESRSGSNHFCLWTDWLHIRKIKINPCLYSSLKSQRECDSRRFW